MESDYQSIKIIIAHLGWEQLAKVSGGCFSYLEMPRIKPGMFLMQSRILGQFKNRTSWIPLGFPIPVFLFHLSGSEQLLDSMCSVLVPCQHHHACCLFVQSVTKVQWFSFHAIQHLCQDWQHICDTSFNPRTTWEGKTETIFPQCQLPDFFIWKHEGLTGSLACGAMSYRPTHHCSGLCITLATVSLSSSSIE